MSAGSPQVPARLIRASAGTGKTYQLSNRFLDLLFAGCEPDEILATTFTRKAAGEILDRVLHRLAEAAADDEARRKLAAALGRQKLTRENCRDLLVGIARNLHRLRIGTLDSFFMQIAGSYALELGLPPGWTIGDEADERRLRDSAVDRVLNEGPLSELLTLFHLLTKGEAGRAIAALMHETVDQIHGLFLDAPKAAWERIPPLKSLKEDELAMLVDAIRTTGPQCDKQVATAVEKDLAALATQDWKLILSRGIAAKVLDDDLIYYRKPLPDSLVELYRKLLQHIGAELVTRVALQTLATRDLLTHFDAVYQQLKDQSQRLRFDDVTRCIAHSAAGNDDRTGNTFRLNGRIRHLLLDEFQDTSPAQWTVLRPFARRVLTEGSFFCVGDVKQAIYAWRGGVAEIFDALQFELKLTPETLAESYRSSPAIIETVNQVFSGILRHDNLTRHEAAITAWCRAFPPHSTARRELPGFAALHVSPEVKDGENKDDVHYDHVADLIAQTVAASPGRSVGVLCRRNQVVARLIYLLRRKGLQASEEGGNPLIDSAPIEAVLSLLRIVDHPGNTVARFHVAHTPLAKVVGYTDWKTPAVAEQLAADLRRRLLDEGYGPVILDWAKKLAPDCNERDRNRLQQLIESAFDYQPQASLRTRDFVELVETQRVPDPVPADIRVMSIHQAKGLEFDIVFLPELAANISGQTPWCVHGRANVTDPIEAICRYAGGEVRSFLPADIQKLFDDSSAQAARDAMCVLYVALTRAVHALHMVIPPSTPGEKKLPKTYAGLLRAALTDGQKLAGQSIPFTLGDPRWFEKLERRPPAEAVAAEELPAVIALAPPLTQRTRGWQRIAPSSLEGGGRVTIDRVFEVIPEYAVGRGRLFHAWFEHITWLDDGPPADDALRKSAARLVSEVGTAGAQVDAILTQFMEVIEKPQLRGVLSENYYRDPAAVGLAAAAAAMKNAALEVEREFPFARLINDELLQGSIDRLILWRVKDTVVAADIVDFKTDGVEADDAVRLKERTDYYRPQLTAYRRAVQQMFELPPECVAARLVFTACDVIAPL